MTDTPDAAEPAVVERQAPTSAKAWKQSAETTDLRVPSGNVCLARVVDMKALVKTGIIPNPLMPIIQSAIKSGKPPDFEKVAKDPEKMLAAIHLIDNIVCEIVADPKVLPVPVQEDPEHEKYDPEFERDEDLLYVDQVSYDDKIFIFQWAFGGTRDLERFREELGESLDALPISEDMVDAAKRLAGLTSG